MEEASKESKLGAYNRRKEILATPPPPTGPPSAAPGTGRVQLVDNMQELAQLGGTGNKTMAYAVPSDVDLVIVSVCSAWWC
jgi:hypothetical protein